jgi:pimeloyl-ACP methyl ester carboxylesterase
MNIEAYTSQNLTMKPWPALAGRGKTLSLNGGKLFFYDYEADRADSGKPALILIHGLGDEADSWRHLMPLLSAGGYRLIAPDLPGFGRSLHNGTSPWRGWISVSAHAQAVISLMREVAEKPVVLVGSSMGALISQVAAFKKPDLVKALILVDGCFPVSISPNWALVLMGLPFFGRSWYRAFRKNHEGAWKSLYPYYGDLDAMSEADRIFLRERVIDRVESSGQEAAYFASLRSLNSVTPFTRAVLSRKTKAFPGKILLLWGEADRIIPVEKIAVFRNLRPDAVFREIPGAGHLPHQESPQKTAEAILRFLEG